MFMMILSKFYVCGLLGALNSRYELRRDMISQPSHQVSAGKFPSHASVPLPVSLSLRSHTEGAVHRTHPALGAQLEP
jgi:hypothetical protein